MGNILATVKVEGVQDSDLKDLDYEIHCHGYGIDLDNDRVKIRATRRYFDINGNHVPSLDTDASYYETDPVKLAAYNAQLEPILKVSTENRLKLNAGLPID